MTLIGLLLVILCCGRAAVANVRSVAISHGTFRITLDDGRLVAQDDLPGTVLTLGDATGRQRVIRIDAVEHDAQSPDGETVLYGLSEPGAGGEGWRAVCEPDADGRRLGFPLPGAFTDDGRYVPSAETLLIACTGSAEGKCIRFGYKPWMQALAGTSLVPSYQACVRLVRADYCGDGMGHTRDGTLIDIFDRIGIHRDEAAPGMSFEAAFTATGAQCVRHTRLPKLLDTAALTATCPRLVGHIGASCDETADAMLFVRSSGH